MQCVLEVGGTDNDRIDVFPFEQFVVVTRFEEVAVVQTFAFKVCISLFTTTIPDVGNGYERKILRFGMFCKSRGQRLAEAIGEADNTHPNPVVRTQDASVATCREAHAEPGQCRFFYKITTIFHVI